MSMHCMMCRCIVTQDEADEADDIFPSAETRCPTCAASIAARPPAASYYVETCDMQDDQLGHDVRFATRDAAESALMTLLSIRQPKGGTPEVMESDLPPNTTLQEWEEAGW